MAKHVRFLGFAVAAAALAALPGTSAAGSTPLGSGRVAARGVLRVHVPEAVGGKTVIGQLTVDQVLGAGYVTAYGCDDGLPTGTSGNITRSDLNVDGRVAGVASNRLIVKADSDGDVCLFTSAPAAMIIDLNAVTFDTGITSFPNRRTDTRLTAVPRLEAAGVLRVSVPEAVGKRTVVGQLTVDRVTDVGYVTAFGCDDGLPRDPSGVVTRSDLNFNGRVSSIASNRLIVQADNDGDVCLYTARPAAVIVDINGVSDVGIASFANRRTDTRGRATPRLNSGSVLTVHVPEAVGAKTVIGQLTVDRVVDAGYVTAYGCDAGLPLDASGAVARSDLNYNGTISSASSNRLIVQADNDGDVCLFTLRPAAIIVDVNGVAGAGINSFANRRVDTRFEAPAVETPTSSGDDGVPVWPAYTTVPAVVGVAALTGRRVAQAVADRPIVAVKIDNYARARPQWALNTADAVFEVNVEGISRFVALFHSQLPAELGPVRSARTGDLNLLAAMNRPVFVYSGANDGVTRWVAAAANSGVVVDFGAQHSPCFRRATDKPGPHNLLLDPTCALATPSAFRAGPARALWAIDARWNPPASSRVDDEFAVAMDGVVVEWNWNPTASVYERWQDGEPHVVMTGARVVASNVVEMAVRYVPSLVDERSPDPITLGTGMATIHRDGRAVAAVWSRATPYSTFDFFDRDTGAPIPLDVGTTFMELTRDR